MSQAKDGCGCHFCEGWREWNRHGPEFPFRVRFIVCDLCGNKRCPHATDHTLACTNSNEPGQPGSIFQ